MARLYEYEGKQLLKDAGITIPEGNVASSPNQVKAIADMIGKPVAIKAQIWATGRYKAGGVKFAETPQEAEEASGELFGSLLKESVVEKVLVEERLDIAQEYFVGVLVDDSYKVRAPVVILGSQGGVDIEEISQASPGDMASVAVDVQRGLGESEAYDLAAGLGVPSRLLEQLSTVLCAAYGVFRQYDARAVEINPLVLTEQGRLYAADCRISIDDSSVSRHPELGISVAREADSPPTELDRIAWKTEEGDYRGISFFAQMGPRRSGGCYIGYHAIGGGCALLAADTLVAQGLQLADYAETSGNPTAAKVYRTAKVILSIPRIEGYCLMGAVLASQNQWSHAMGLVKAFREELKVKPGFPVVILLAGNKETESLDILREGLMDLPIRLEIYGRQHIHKLDSVAARMRSLVDEYRESRREGDST